MPPAKAGCGPSRQPPASWPGPALRRLAAPTSHPRHGRRSAAPQQAFPGFIAWVGERTTRARLQRGEQALQELPGAGLAGLDEHLRRRALLDHDATVEE